MATTKPHRSSPDHSLTRMPKGVPYIVGNEAAERFSYYGMRAILLVFMTDYLVDALGNDATFSDRGASSVYHAFVAATYFTPMVGALIADVWWGKYKTILYVSLLYCVGHGCLALMDLGPATGAWDMRPFLYSGLFLICLGAGGIKPCVAAHVGDQFGHGNKRLMTQVFNWFYFSINVGAAASQVLTPWLLANYGPHIAFGLPGVLMGLATFVFWLGRHSFIHVPPAGLKRWAKETVSPAGLRAIANLSPLFFLFVPMFWAVFDQTGSAWVLQADQMDRELGILWLPSQIQFVNPVLILLGIPFFTYVVYPFAGKFVRVTPLRKIGAGLVLTSLSFGVSALVEGRIQARQADIARLMYQDLAREVLALTFPDDGRRAKVVKASIGAVAASSLTLEQQLELLVVDFAALGRNAADDRLEDILAAESAAASRQALGLPAVDAPESAASTRAILDAAASASWSTDDYAAAGFSLRALVNALEDQPLLALFPVDRAASVYALLSESMASGAPASDLGAAVRAGRATWVSPPAVAGAMEKPDEVRISMYLASMPNIFWQFIAYFILTAAEIMVSIVCLEFSYSQSPPKMKSIVMAAFYFSVFIGNIFVSIVNAVIAWIESSTGVNPLEGANYYWFFGGIMLVIAVAYIAWAPFYKGQTFIQGNDEDERGHAEAGAEATEPR
jgi:POT family proton-dependent oligopeptide transporter